MMTKKEDGKINGLPREIHCDLVNTLKMQCAEYNILELWKYDEAMIRNLTRQEIIDDINTVTGYDADFTIYLGGKKYNSSGSVVGATSVVIKWNTEWAPDKLEHANKISGFDFHLADPFTMQWESSIINRLLSQTKKMQDDGKGFDLYLNFIRRY
jgi:hypothetical protein